MNFRDAYTFIEEASTEHLVIYVGIGCRVGHYPPNAHPPQQYPPYLRAFQCRQICVLIDPELEMPPRIYDDLEHIPQDVTVLTIREWFGHSSKYGETDTSWFLNDLARLCTIKQNFMIVHEFTGSTLNNYYPIHLGREVLNYVLYDPTYSHEGSCGCDFDKIQVIRNAEGKFRQPFFSPLAEIADQRTLALQMLEQRKYPILHFIARLYRILNSREEERDWCTIERVTPHIEYFRFIYDIAKSDILNRVLQQVLTAVVRDIAGLCNKTLTDGEVTALVESSGREIEIFWKESIETLIV